jgi:hypothetical protein
VTTSEYLLLIVFVPFFLIFFWISIGVTVVPGWGKCTCTIVELTMVGILYCTDCSRSRIPSSIYDRHAALFHSYRKFRPVQPIGIMLFPPIVTKRCTSYTFVPTTTIAKSGDIVGIGHIRNRPSPPANLLLVFAQVDLL